MITPPRPARQVVHRPTREVVRRQKDGFRAHVVVEPDTGLITTSKLTKVSGPANSDAAVGAELLAADTTIDQPVADQNDTTATTATTTTTIEVLGDSAYGSGDMLAAIAAAGHTPVIKPWPLRPAVEGGFTLDDFSIDEGAGTVTCPAGLTRTMTANRTATFGVACASCPLRQRCTTSATGRTIKVHVHHELQREHRVRAADPDFQATYRQHRPMVERSLAWLTRRNRRVPYRGIAKNDAWMQHRVAAINLRRLLTLGLQHTQTGWALAAT